MGIKSVVTESGKVAYDRFHFSQATESDGFLFCSGVIGTGADRKLPEDVKEEFRNAWQSIGKLLAEAGLGFSDILEYTSYHVGLQENIVDFMAVRDEFLSAPWPAWTAIGITELAVPGAHVEIRVTAQKS
jgi:enamine deaminase RidA (YjgF/YER057c/UK114 family)